MKFTLLFLVTVALFFRWELLTINLPGHASAQTNIPNSANSCTQGTSFFYCQHDPRWANLPSQTSVGCNMTHAGSGPTTLAMVLVRFNITTIPAEDMWGIAKIPPGLAGQPTTPPNIDSILRENNWRQCASDFLHQPEGVFDWLRSIGFQVQDIIIVGPINSGVLDLVDAKKYLDHRYLLIIGASNFPGVNGVPIDHIQGVSGVDLINNKIRVFDPNNCAPDNVGEGPRVYIDNIAYDWAFAKAVIKP